MNALSIAWKLRADMLAILAAAAPQGGERPSEHRHKVTKVPRAKSDIRELLVPERTDAADTEADLAQASGTGADSSGY